MRALKHSPQHPLYATVGSKGQFVIPAPIREALGIEPGTRIAIRCEGSRVILDPETMAAKLRLIDDMHGSTAGHGSGTDLLPRGASP